MYKVAVVVYVDTISSKHYHFRTSIDLKIGDTVVVESRAGLGLAKVIDLVNKSQYADRWVVCKVPERKVQEVKDFKIGDEAFHNGRPIKIIGAMPGKWVIWRTDVATDTAKIVAKESVVENACGYFTVGDPVEAKFGTFKGVVTAFEEDANRIVCLSIRGNDRVRYAYKANELQKTV